MKVNHVLNHCFLWYRKEYNNKKAGTVIHSPGLSGGIKYSDRKAMLANCCDDLAGENPLAC